MAWVKYVLFFLKVPLQYILEFWWNQNSSFADQAFWVKNAYISFVTWFWTENILYTAYCYLSCKNVYSSFYIVENCENIYFSFNINTSYKIFYSKYIINSSNIWFSTNLIGCHDCIFCNWLENQSYCIKNKQYSKKEYQKLKKEILKNKDEFLAYYKKLNKVKPLDYNSKNCSWKRNLNSINVENWYFTNYLKNSRNVMFAWDAEEFYDSFDAWVNSKGFYWVVGAWNSCNDLYISMQMDQCSEVYYSYFLSNCHHCLWCVWLKNKSYCILNKQYSKQEWEELACKIFEQMEKEGTLWDFFPAKLNPFYFNDTVAGLIGGFTKEEIVKEWFMWRDEEIEVDIPDESLVISVSDLDKYEWFDTDWNWKINPEILKKVIKDEKWNYYRIVKLEYDFLVKHALPLPRLHWLDRMKLNFGV